MIQMPTVEGFTPQVLWTTVCGVIALGLLFLIFFKVYDAIHVIRERKRAKEEANKPDFAKKVGKEVFYSLDDEHVSMIFECALAHVKE